MALSDAAARRCGICLRSPREDDPTHIIGIHAVDIAALPNPRRGLDPRPVTPGVYQCCEDCRDRYLPLIAARLRQTPAVDDEGRAIFRDARGERVWDGTGERQMVLGAHETMSIHLAH